MNPDNEIEFEFPGCIRVYKGGRVERLSGLNFTPVSAGLDPETGVTSKDIIINPSTGVLARIYHPNIYISSQGTKKLPIIVYYHGGAFVEGSAFDLYNHGFMNRLTSQANAICVSVEYRLAPENPVPVPFDDSLDAFNWVLSRADLKNGDLNNVFVAGFSAGATIAHNIASRSEFPFKGLVIIHPFFLASQRLPSEPIDPILRDGLERLWTYISRFYNTGTVDDPLINPLSETAPGLEGLKCERVMICLDDAELKVRGKAYCEKLKQCGWGENNNLEVVESKQGHGFFFAKPECEDALEMMSRLVAFFKRV